MALWQGPREALIHGIGLLAGSLRLCGIHGSNNELNDRVIDQYDPTELLDDRMFIRRFYVYETLIRHNFVVLQTDSGHTFKVHLIADVDRKYYRPIRLEIRPTDWRPNGKYVYQCNKPAWLLKYFIKNEIPRFGTYQVGFNDCRHFARAVAVFLAN